MHAWAKPRFSLAIALACGKSPVEQVARGAGGAVVDDDEVERLALRVLEQRRQTARQEALLVVRDDDDRQIGHGRTVAARRGRDSAYLDER